MKAVLLSLATLGLMFVGVGPVLARNNKQLPVQPATITRSATVGNNVAVTPVLWRRYYGGPWVWYRPQIYRPYYGFGTYYYPYRTYYYSPGWAVPYTYYGPGGLAFYGPRRTFRLWW